MVVEDANIFTLTISVLFHVWADENDQSQCGLDDDNHKVKVDTLWHYIFWKYEFDMAQTLWPALSLPWLEILHGPPFPAK